LQQEAVWKKTRLKLYTFPPHPEIREPVEIFIDAKKEGVETPFVGEIRLGVERLSTPTRPLQETTVGSEDQKESGLWQITQAFTESGVYGIVVSFSDPEGEIFLLRGKVGIGPPPGFIASIKIGLYIAAGLVILTAIFYKIIRSRRRP